MKKAFTLIELIFVIVIIGVLASFAIPKFRNLAKHAKESNIKSVITSVQASIDNIHGKWIINDNYKWIGADGADHSSDFNDTSGYPNKLDVGDGKNLFSYVLKIPIPSCGNGKTNGCWSQEDNVTYKYHFTPSKEYQFRYDSSRGVLDCNNSDKTIQNECEKTIY